MKPSGAGSKRQAPGYTPGYAVRAERRIGEGGSGDGRVARGIPRGYNPASRAISALLFRALSVADFNCPQAAMISSPRGVRIGEA